MTVPYIHSQLLQNLEHSRQTLYYYTIFTNNICTTMLTNPCHNFRGQEDKKNFAAISCKCDPVTYNINTCDLLYLKIAKCS